MKFAKEITLAGLARELGGKLVGEGNSVVKGISDLEDAKKGDLTFLLKKKFESALKTTKASFAVVPENVGKASIPVIKCKNPNLAFKKTAEILLPCHIPHPKGIHNTASIGENVKLGREVSVGAYACLEDGVEIGDGTVIYAQSYVGSASKIGKNSIIYPNVTIRENIIIGDRVTVHSGSTIGSDGFGYEPTNNGHVKIPHIGNVVIEDDVEIGASTTIDRAKFSSTKIGKGTKIDNLVQIAHNVTIGSNCIIIAQCGISGSVKIGSNVMMGGQVGIADHLEIGDNVMIAAAAKVMKSIPPNMIMWGIPARPLKQGRAIHALVDRLPELYERLNKVEKKLG